MSLNDAKAYLAHHYIHEVNMLRQTYYHHGIATEQVVKNALYESFCIHVRALWDFYSPQQNPHQSDVLACQFASSWQPNSTQVSQLGDNLRKQINKQIAHLTTDREIAVRILPTDMKILLDAINLDHNHFVQTVDSNYQDCFGEEMKVAGVVHLVASQDANNVVQASSATSLPA